jgi:hypothetical protein
VTSVDLVGLQAEPLVSNPFLELKREHPVVAASQHAGWDIGPRRQRPGLAERVVDWSCQVRVMASVLTSTGKSW